MSVEEIIAAGKQLPEQDRLRVIEALAATGRSHTRPAERAERSAYEKAKHLIGSIEGPHDLGSNPAYLKGYGRDSMS